MDENTNITQAENDKTAEAPSGAESSGFVHSGSANIYYEIFGRGNKETVILLHGNGESGRSFKKLVPLLSDEYRVITIDSRGHGRSDFGGSQLSLGTMAVDVVNIFEALNIEKANIVGFSDGANIAMLTAIKNSELIEKAVFIGGNYRFSGLKPSSALMIALGYYCSLIGGVFDSRNRFNKEYFSLMYKEPALSRDTLKYIKVPVLVINGDRDMIRTSHAKAMAQTIPKGELKIVNGDHFWVYRKPEEAAGVIKDFLKK